MTERSRFYKLTASGLRYAIGIVILWWVLNQADWRSFEQLIDRLSLFVTLTLVAVSIAGAIARFYTWKVLLDSVGTSTLVQAANVDLATNFINQLFPSRVSGRSISPLVVNHATGIELAKAIAVTGIHTGLFALLYGIVAAIGVIIIFDELSVAVSVVVVGSTALYLVVGLSIILGGLRLEGFQSIIESIFRRLDRIPIGNMVGSLAERVPQFTTASGEAFRTIWRDRPTVVAYAISWAISLMIAAAVRFWLLLDVLDVISPPPVILPFIIVAAYSVTLLPLTPGGIGVTEATATLVFASLGIPAGIAATAILADRFLGVYLPALVGWYPTVKLDIRDMIMN